MLFFTARQAAAVLVAFVLAAANDVSIAAIPSSFALFTPNDLAAFKVPTPACAAALGMQLQCSRAAVFGNLSSLNQDAERAAFCDPKGACQQSLQALNLQVQKDCPMDFMLGPTANIAYILRHLVLSSALPCANDAASGANCVKQVKDVLSKIDPKANIFDVLDKKFACGCFLAATLLRKPVDANAQQMLYILRTRICGENSVQDAVETILLPTIPNLPYVPPLQPANSSMTFDAYAASPQAEQCGPAAATPLCPNGQCCSLKGLCGSGPDFCGPDNCRYGYGPCTHRTVDPKAICGATSANFAVCPTGCCNGQGLCGLGFADCMLADPQKPSQNGAPTGCQIGFGPGQCTQFFNQNHQCGPYATAENRRCPKGTCCDTSIGQCGTFRSFCDRTTCNPIYGDCGPQTFDKTAVCGFTSVNQTSCGPTACCGKAGQCAASSEYCSPSQCQEGFGACGWPLDIKCSAATMMSQDGVNYIGNWTATPANASATIPCANGNANGNVTAECLSNGLWGKVVSTCNPPIVVCPTAAGWTSKLAGQNATQSCSNGFAGNMTARCNPDGIWATPDTSQCYRIGCPAFDVFPATPFNGIASAPCPVLFSGNQTARCLPSGKWTTVDTSQCVWSKESTCVSDVFPRTPLGQNATGPCPSPLVGNQTALCGPAGIWAPADTQKCITPTNTLSTTRTAIHLTTVPPQVTVPPVPSPRPT